MHRPPFGTAWIYEDESFPGQIVFGCAPSDDEPRLEVTLGGEPMMVVAHWFAPLESAEAMLRDFFAGRRFAAGSRWTDFLVNI